MKAIVWTAYGPPEVLKLQEVPRPHPKDNEVLIRIRATTVTAGDCEARSLKFPPWLAVPMRLYAGIRRPSRIRILGQELAGDVESVGRDVTRLRPGEPVFAVTGFTFGAYAEYICLPEQPGNSLVLPKPVNLTYDEAAAVPVAGLEALHWIRRGAVQKGERVLIYGAGGSIGTYAVQLAKHREAEVTAVDRGEKLAMLRSIGADHVIDYLREDFSKSGKTYDVIVDVVGKSSFDRSIAALSANGRYLLANPRLIDKVRGSRLGDGGKRVIAETAGRDPADLDYLRELIEAGRLKPVIDRRYPLAQAAEAHRYAESGLKHGNIVLTVAGEPPG